MINESDAELVKRFQRGDIAAFECFIERYQDRLYRLARVFLYEGQSADDAVQEVLIRAYRGLPAFRFASKPFSWMYRVLKNVCSEMNRRAGREAMPSQQTEPAIDEARLYEQRQCLQQVYDALSELGRRERDVVLLRVFEGCSEKETATILGVRPGTVKTLLHRGLKKLREKHGEIIEIA